MPTDLPLRCSCGALRGIVRGISPDRGNRLVCYCNDCQSFAYFLGNADTLLDSRGGTDIFQTSPARIEITHGAEQLACMSLRPGGLMRWYSSCCRTAIGNTLARGRAPFIGLILGGLPKQAGGDAFGPVRRRVFARYARTRVTSADASDGTSLAGAWRLLWVMLSARLRGDQRRSPFFDPKSGDPVATPRVLSAMELEAVEEARDAYRQREDE